MAVDGRSAPVLEGAGRRWFFRHLGIGLGLGFLFAEAFWRLHAVPRRSRRDQYYKELGVEWTKIID